MLRKHCVQAANTAQPTPLRTYHKPCAYPDFSRAWRQPRIPACAMRATAPRAEYTRTQAKQAAAAWAHCVTQARCQTRCNTRRGAQASDRCHARAQAATARQSERSRLGSTVVHTVSHSAVLQWGPHPPCTTRVNQGGVRWIDRGVDHISDPSLRLLLFGESETPLVLCERHWRRGAASARVSTKHTALLQSE